jgi:hypothetical protein
MLLLVGLALALRLLVICAAPEQLTQDRDLYLGIASELRTGHGYCTPGSDPPRPTAFRPPLYPLLLWLTGGGPLGGATLHLALASLMAVTTGLAARRMSGNHPLWVLAPAIVAVDPLLLLYSRQPMTETLCACLSAVLIWRVACRDQTASTWKVACGEGVLWGLCLLARPTYGAALAIWLLISAFAFSPLHTGEGPGVRVCDRGKSPRAYLLLVITITLLTISPWAIRNWQVFGRPIVTTTHGGYTLWLANNPVYYREVVEGGAPAWDGDSLARWQAETDQNLDQREILGEVNRNRALSQQAQAFILENPVRFVRACLFRARTFWAITPSRTAGEGQNQPMLWAVGGFYLALWVGGIASLVRFIRTRSLPLSPGISMALSLILGFFLVHLIYWTDVRMRAPIMPTIAVLVAAGWRTNDRSSQPTD